jgi:primosomal protein N' (replication factor Y) (superfamily II helicase)
MANSPGLVRVAVPLPLAEAFDYALAGGVPPPIGGRVRVPFGRGERIGVVIDHPERSAVARHKLKVVGKALDREPAIGAELLKTLRWAADYYHYPLGEVLSHALPGMLREGRSLDEPAERVWRVSATGAEQSLESLRRRAPRQAAALGVLCAAGTALGESLLKARGVGTDVLAKLVAKGWVERSEAPIAAPAAARPPRGLPALPTLTEDQRRTIEAVEATYGDFQPHLLVGVTGSGKTEVYLRLAASQLAARRQTLLLVPEIGLTPQLVARLAERFGDTLAVLHSGLTERERFEAWRRAHRGEAKLIVGTRSAVFAPLPAAGLIIVDEEHDPSYKQQRGFRYSARDLAVVRARRLAIPVLLASATPSLESLYNARQGRYRRLTMPQRIGAAGQPRLTVIDLNLHASRQELSTPLVAAIGRHLADGNQVLLFLNRRGFAPALFCPTCKTVEECTRCDARMTVHARSGQLRCHHCGQQRPLLAECPACGNERIPVGAGTQRVDEELVKLFPAACIARMDRDATGRKGALQALLRDVRDGRVQILVGTQMLTKGHDFPRVTLVGVLNADQGLFGTDPRSHERLAQTILQVAGRAGRAERPGEVLIQTHYPDHPLLKGLLSQDYESFATLALAERAEAHWPPFWHLAAWHAEAARREPVFAFLNRVRAVAMAGTHTVDVLGPAPAQMERKDGRYRAHLLLQSPERGPLRALLGRVLAEVRGAAEARKVRWSLDVDPLEL